MPELPPKRSGDIASFDRLSRLIGDGSLRPKGDHSGDKPARKIPSGRGPGPSPAPAYAELQVTSNFSFLLGASHPDELVVTRPVARPPRDPNPHPQRLSRPRPPPSPREAGRPPPRHRLPPRFARRHEPPRLSRGPRRLWPPLPLVNPR